jgi:hypothetical protein
MEGAARRTREQCICSLDVAANLNIKGVPCRALNILGILENLGDSAFCER